VNERAGAAAATTEHPLHIASTSVTWTHRRVPQLVSRLGKAVLAISAIGGAVGGLLSTGPAGVVSGAGVLSAVAAVFGTFAYLIFLASLIDGLTPRHRLGNVTVMRDDLRVVDTTGTRVVRLRDIAAALVVDLRPVSPQGPPPLVPYAVDLDLVGGDRLRIHLPTREDAQTMVERVGFGPGGRRMRLDVTALNRRLIHPLIGFGAHAVTSGLMMAILFAGTGVFSLARLQPLVALLLYEGVRRLVRPPTFTVGDDAVTAEAFGRKSVALRDLGPADAAPILAAGSGVDHVRRRALLQAIDERQLPTRAAGDRHALYAREGMPLTEWRGQLARVMAGSYREGASTIEEAAAVLRSVQATKDQRVGAALALRAAGEPAERIRVAAEAAADPALHDALVAVADDHDDAAVEKALKRMVAR